MTQPTGTDSTTALAARFEQAVKDESPSAVAALFADDGSMWLVDDNAPDGVTFQGRAGVEEAFAGIFAGVQLDLAIGAPSHTVAVDEAGERRLESGVLVRTIASARAACASRSTPATSAWSASSRARGSTRPCRSSCGGSRSGRL